MRRFLKRPTHVPGEVGALSGCRPVLAFIPLRERPAGVFGLELLSGMMWPGRAGTGYLLNFKSVRAASRLALSYGTHLGVSFSIPGFQSKRFRHSL